MTELKIVKLHEMNDIKLGLRNDKLYFKDDVDAYISKLCADHEATVDEWYRRFCYNKWRRAYGMYQYCLAMNQLEASTPPSTMSPHQLWRYLTAYWRRWAERWFRIYILYKDTVE